jgi:protein TonB
VLDGNRYRRIDRACVSVPRPVGGKTRKDYAPEQSTGVTRAAVGRTGAAGQGSSCQAWVAEPESMVRRQGLLGNAFWAFTGALLMHAALLALLFWQPQREVRLIANTEPPASVRVTLVQPLPEPPAAPPQLEPEVLTTAQAERSVSKAEAPKPLPKPLPVKPKTVPVKPQISRRETPPKVPSEPVEPELAQAPSQKVTSDVDGEKYLDLPSSGPKDVQSVGCRVPAPSYPRQALRQRIEGVVLVQLVIDDKGRVETTRVLKSSGSDLLDKAALKAVSGASCTPHVENGQAISVRAAQPVSFRVN